MHTTSLHTVEKSEPLHTCYSSKNISRIPKRCPLNSLWNNQTCHVICIWIRNRSTLLWIQKLQPPLNHPWIIGTLPRGANTSHHWQLHFSWPHPRHNYIKIIKLQWHLFPMVKMSWNTTYIQFLIGTWIHQTCRLPNQISRLPTLHTRAITICSTKEKKL